MESWNHLALGFGVASTPLNLLYAFCGSALGTLVGVLPGLAPVGVVAMLLPAVLSLDATSSLVLLAGVYVGAQYGGSIRAILVPASERAGPAATAVDGVQMSRQGRAATALAIATLGSFFAGCVSTALIAAGAPLLGGLASRLGPTEVCSLMVLGL
ncbi:MAG: tripartite tricarboxylate transporter permease, partial [Actinomycetota bacterium]|nr:tripartite tricarboxylate transporter permease [Actinomycetota bacterium]